MSKKHKSKPVRAAAPVVRFGEGELADIRLVLLSLVVPTLVWLIVLGWSFGDLLGAHDNVLAVLQMKLASEAGGWRGMLYQWWGFGGGELVAVTGFPPMTSLLLAIGLSPVSVVSSFNLFTHFGSAFLGARIAIELACWFSTDPARVRAIRTFSWIREASLVLLFGFLPVLAWRIPFGHQLIIIGYWALLGWILTFSAGMQRSLSFTVLAVVVLLDLHVFPVVGQQTLIYSAVFGLPVAAVLYWRGRRIEPRAANRHLLISTMIPVLALLASLPVLQLMIRFATSTEAMRGTASGSVIYGYIVSQFQDWWSSIPWARDAVSFGRDFGFHHEVNYAVGPLLLVFLFLGLSRGLALAILGGGIAVIGLASRWPGISDALLAAIPILKSFRVPARGFVLTSWLISIVGAASLLRGLSNPNSRKWAAKDLLWPAGILILLVIGGASSEEGAMARELITWGLVAYVVVQLWRARSGGSPAFSGWVVLFLAVASLLAFRERGSMVVRRSDAWSMPIQLREDVWRQAPETRHPLNRVVVASESPTYLVNTGSVAGLGHLSGYFAAPKRFLQLQVGLRSGQQPDPAMSISRVSPSDPEFGILAALYNVRYVVQEQNGRRVVASLPQALDYEHAPGWISRQARILKDWPELWRELQSTHAAGAYGWKSVRAQESWILAQDQARAPQAQGCSLDRPVVALGSPERLPREASLRVSGFQGRCLLTVAMNYSPSLRVFAGDVELSTFPSYGALLGVSISAEEAAAPVRIVSRAEVPAWAWASQVLGLVGLIGVMGVAMRRQASFPQA